MKRFLYVHDIFNTAMVFLLISQSAATTLCPAGWQNNGTNNCYFFTSNGKNWQSAENDCQQRGAHLASIHGEAENIFLSSFSAARIWIGLNDLIQEGSFRWTDGSALNFSNWGSGQPDFKGIEQCTGLNYLSFGVWNNFQCIDEYAYICMKEDMRDVPSTQSQGTSGIQHDVPLCAAQMSACRKAHQIQCCCWEPVMKPSLCSWVEQSPVGIRRRKSSPTEQVVHVSSRKEYHM
ncbi:perlucin-like protein [Haliotis asinina]|uniref:perlucin-like protein n=1 Tax=Haliotis asinina TaxID=109174 RepID=UPI003531AB20